MKNPQKYIAVTQKGRVMHRAELYTMLDKLYSKLYIKKRGVHILRHTFGKRMVKKNVNLSTIKELMGHENIQTTMIYARSDERGMIRAVSS
jgi:site-specific recombinase XerD